MTINGRYLMKILYWAIVVQFLPQIFTLGDFLGVEYYFSIF